MVKLYMAGYDALPGLDTNQVVKGQGRLLLYAMKRLVPRPPRR